MSAFSESIVSDIVNQLDRQIKIQEEIERNSQDHDTWMLNNGWLNGLREARNIVYRNL